MVTSQPAIVSHREYSVGRAARHRSALRPPWQSAIAILCGLLLTGCGSSAVEETTTDAAMIDELLNGSAAGKHSSREPAEPVESGARYGQTHTVSAGEKQQTGDRSPLGERLELNLRVGERFPMVKTVHQVLTQYSETAPALAVTHLELSMVITVEEERRDAIRLGVQYARIAYSHDIAGQRLMWDSANHEGVVPWDVIPYAGMVGNGFSFWLGRNNTIREMVGYRDFLERCVAQVPMDRRESLLTEISGRFGDDGVANFVDDSIGILPYDSTVDSESATRVLPGDSWTREQRLMQPVPVHMTTTFRLASLTPESAEIEITGRIAPGEATSAGQSRRIRISSGLSIGNCQIDRKTGLPLEVNLTRRLRMHISTAEISDVVQDKEIVTMIRTFPETRGPVAGSSSPRRYSDNHVRPAMSDSVHSTAPADATSRDSGRVVRAVYPD